MPTSIKCWGKLYKVDYCVTPLAHASRKPYNQDLTYATYGLHPKRVPYNATPTSPQRHPQHHLRRTPVMNVRNHETKRLVFEMTHSHNP